MEYIQVPIGYLYLDVQSPNQTQHSPNPVPDLLFPSFPHQIYSYHKLSNPFVFSFIHPPYSNREAILLAVLSKPSGALQGSCPRRWCREILNASSHEHIEFTPADRAIPLEELGADWTSSVRRMRDHAETVGESETGTVGAPTLGAALLPGGISGGPVQAHPS